MNLRIWIFLSEKVFGVIDYMSYSVFKLVKWKGELVKLIKFVKFVKRFIGFMLDGDEKFVFVCFGLKV